MDPTQIRCPTPCLLSNGKLIKLQHGREGFRTSYLIVYKRSCAYKTLKSFFYKNETYYLPFTLSLFYLNSKSFIKTVVANNFIFFLQTSFSEGMNLHPKGGTRGERFWKTKKKTS